MSPPQLTVMSNDISGDMCVSREDVACYRLYAANCLEMAEHSEETDRKLFLLRIAQGWVNLADHMERQEGPRIGGRAPDLA
jgi:hypothetical protein